MTYTYRIGLIPRDSANKLSDVCEKNGCELCYAGFEDGMVDVYIKANDKNKIRTVADQSWFRFYPEDICEY